MRIILELSPTKPANMTMEQWVGQSLALIKAAATEDVAIQAAEAFTIDHDAYTILETFDPNTATTAQVARALATLIKHLQSHGPRRDG